MSNRPNWELIISILATAVAWLLVLTAVFWRRA